MAISRIPVDVMNPGQVFASLGFVEAIEVLTGRHCSSRFDIPYGAAIGNFEIDSGDGIDHIGEVIEFLSSANVSTIMPPTLRLKATKVQVPEIAETRSGNICDAPPPQTRATLPAVLASQGSNEKFVIDSWCDGAANGRDNVKFWAGAGGYPGAALLRDALKLLSSCIESRRLEIAADPFDFSAPMSSSLRFDWRRDYMPLDVGFSPNNHHGNVTMVGYPLVEVLAVIGIEYARPSRIDPRDKLNYRYGIWTTPFPTSFARVALGGTEVLHSTRLFRMALGWPGKKNQARCIISVHEETT